MIKNGNSLSKGAGNKNTHKYKTWKDEEEKKNGRAKNPALFISAGASPLLGRGGFLPVLMVRLSGHMTRFLLVWLQLHSRQLKYANCCRAAPLFAAEI